MCKGAKNVFARVLLIIPETAVNEMIRPEFFERKDLTAAQKCFLEFLRAFAFNAGITLHAKILYGNNTHHKIEALFKALGHALTAAVRKDGSKGVLSTKGVL